MIHNNYHNPVKETKYKDATGSKSYSLDVVPIRENKRVALPKQSSSKVQKMDGFGVKVSLEESAKPNTTVRVVDKFKRVIGEKPIVEFQSLINLKNETPQIDTIIGFETDMIVGTDLNINADDEEAKEICETFANDVALYEKIQNHVNTSLTTGFGLLVRVRENGVLSNIEEFDISSLYETYRDEYGNVISYVQELNGEYYTIKEIDDFIPLVFKKNNRSSYGLSEFHAMAVSRNTGNRTTRPLVKALQSLDDVVIGTLENFAFPVEYHTYEGANTEQLEEEARKYRDKKPGDTFFINRPHEIDRREPTQAKFDQFFQWYKDLLQHGTGFPLDMLTGDFASRASSETADSFFMRKIRSYQKYLVKLIKTEIFEELLRSLGWDEGRIQTANVQIEFEVKSEQAYTPEIVGQRVQMNIWTIDEAREYDKANGQDLFDDDKILQQEEERKQFAQQQFELQKSQSDGEKNQAQQTADQKRKDTEEHLKQLELRIEEIKERKNISDKYQELFDKIDTKMTKVREAMEQENNSLTTRRVGILKKLEEKLDDLG